MRLYFVSGLGANEHAFDRILTDWEGEKVFLDWLLPEKKETIAHYAGRMAEGINTDEPFCFVGLSFGGIMVQEMSRFLHPEKTFLISTVQSNRELRPGFKILAKSGLNKKIPIHWINNETILTYALARRLYTKKMPKLDKFFTQRDPRYIRWSIDQVINWTGDLGLANLIHLHGDRYMVFPHRFLEHIDYLIADGTHLMVFNKATEINQIIKSHLDEY